MQTIDRSFLERDVIVCLVIWLVSFIRFDNVSFLNIVFTREFVKRFSAGLYILFILRVDVGLACICLLSVLVGRQLNCKIIRHNFWKHKGFKLNGGEDRIRTCGELAPTHAFQACPLNRSGTSPLQQISYS